MSDPADTRVLLRFDREARDPERLRGHLSACARDREGHLWLGTDELTALSRLKPKAHGVFAKHDYTDLSDRLQLVADDEEIDVEGFDIEGVAARGERLFLGLRGPMLRGWAMLLELRAERTADDTLALGPIGASGRPYR